MADVTHTVAYFGVVSECVNWNGEASFRMLP